jgi:hypothetical protein
MEGTAMGLFSKVNDPFNTMGNDSQHHKTPCDTDDQADGRPYWAGKKNPMGWGNDNPRAPKDTRPAMHGSKAEWRLMSGVGALIKQDATRVPLTGGRPGRNSRGPRPGRK